MQDRKDFVMKEMSTRKGVRIYKEDGELYSCNSTKSSLIELLSIGKNNLVKELIKGSFIRGYHILFEGESIEDALETRRYLTSKEHIDYLTSKTIAGNDYKLSDLRLYRKDGHDCNITGTREICDFLPGISEPVIRYSVNKNRGILDEHFMLYPDETIGHKIIMERMYDEYDFTDAVNKLKSSLDKVIFKKLDIICKYIEDMRYERSKPNDPDSRVIISNSYNINKIFDELLPMDKSDSTNEKVLDIFREYQEVK